MDIDRKNWKVLAEREREYEIGDVWRDGRAWKVKLPGGILGTTTKRHAMAFAAALANNQ